MSVTARLALGTGLASILAARTTPLADSRATRAGAGTLCGPCRKQQLCGSSQPGASANIASTSTACILCNPGQQGSPLAISTMRMARMIVPGHYRHLVTGTHVPGMHSEHRRHRHLGPSRNDHQQKCRNPLLRHTNSSITERRQPPVTQITPKCDHIPQGTRPRRVTRTNLRTSFRKTILLRLCVSVVRNCSSRKTKDEARMSTTKPDSPAPPAVPQTRTGIRSPSVSPAQPAGWPETTP